jgi:hypothetical protein
MTTRFDVFAAAKTPFASFEEATRYLEEACQEVGFRHLSYWCISYADGAPDQVSWIATYPPDYMNHYMANFTPIGDPAFEATMSGPVISDWEDFKGDRSVQRIHDVASNYGIAKHGLSVPIRDLGHADILFSANIDCKDHDWPERRIELSSIVVLMAHHYHRRVSPLIRARHDRLVTRAA